MPAGFLGSEQAGKSTLGYERDSVLLDLRPLQYDVAACFDRNVLCGRDGNVLIGRDGNAHGFLDVDGIFSTIDIPGASFTSATGIDNAGRIVGSFDDGQNRRHGFIRSGASSSIIDVPGADSTVIAGINNVGQIVGSFHDITGYHSFIYSNGNFTTTFAFVTGINSRGQMVGVGLAFDLQGFITPCEPAAPCISLVPEPYSYAFVGFGAGLFLLSRKRLSRLFL